MRVPRVVANAVTMRSNLMWVNERAVQVVSEPQDLISDKNDGVTSRGAGVRRRTFGNGNVRFWLIFCRKGRYVAILAG